MEYDAQAPTMPAITKRNQQPLRNSGSPSALALRQLSAGPPF